MMTAIADTVRGWQVTLAEAAHKLGITQPRLNQLLRGRMSLFSLGALTDLAMRAGIGVTVKLTPPRTTQAAARTKVAAKPGRRCAPPHPLSLTLATGSSARQGGDRGRGAGCPGPKIRDYTTRL